MDKKPNKVLKKIKNTQEEKEMRTRDLDTLLENEYPYEPPIQVLPKQKIMTPEAERFNGWAAMLGFVAALGAYVTTGLIIPGVF